MNRHTQFIGEEASYKWEGTTAQTLGVRWGNIDMPMDERERRRNSWRSRCNAPAFRAIWAIKQELRFLKKGINAMLAMAGVELEVRVPSDVIREQFMFDRIQENAGDADRIIVICGIIHSEKLSERFRETGAQVEVEIWPLPNYAPVERMVELKKNLRMTKAALLENAIHECGHAVVGADLGVIARNSGRSLVGWRTRAAWNRYEYLVRRGELRLRRERLDARCFARRRSCTV